MKRVHTLTITVSTVALDANDPLRVLQGQLASACIWNLDAVDRIDPPPNDRLKLLPRLNDVELDVLANALAHYRGCDIHGPETERIVMSLQTAIAEARHNPLR